MSQDIDFLISDIKTIAKPEKPKPIIKKQHKRSEPVLKAGSFEIQKSFIPEQKSSMPEQQRKQIEEMKKFIKEKTQREKKMKQKLAEGVIDRENLKEKNQEDKSEKEQKLIVDGVGHLRDQKGNIVFVKSHSADLKINKKIQQKKKIKELQKKKQIKVHQKIGKSFLDRNLSIGTYKRREKRSKLGLQFLEQGSYEPIIIEKNNKQQINDVSDVFKEEQDVKIVKKRKRAVLQYNKDIPDVQWWDKEIIQLERYEEMVKEENVDFQELINKQKLAQQVTYQKVGEQKKQAKVVMPIYLTKEERKKLKRKRKKQKLMEKNDMIKLGIIEPEKPKIKISNMAVVMKNEFIIDPSKIEAEAKKQVQQRLNNHLQSNQERKLTRSQRKEKVLRKLKRDSAKECKRIVFTLQKLDDPAHIFKINKNAQQLALNGFLIRPSEYHHQPVMIAIQGGIKATQFYKNLMMKRINWEENQNKCKIIWEGTVESQNLGKWKQYLVGDQSQTLKVLSEKQMQHFWEHI